ncbi:DnaB-like helicase N-terminal domain-containing protein [Neobacillus sp. PS3-12]|uniref:DnaB-like helicase N-terminal domain-containing protein n=1 Tax=Neobacillus sp. PS3-12 TaxID=3070677 RepID=UPI0027DFAD90|nr:DnaB-like helicase N-terminal domain-containing protein [Neobacillus sp. PS3-12]WML52350.1 DnaB-like helicase N-terminal domain-containing protein [Neobacillus sp. PS3-12]
MSIAEKTFLGSLMKAEYLLKDTVVQPEQLESSRHQELMRRMVELKRAGKNIDVITMTTLPDLESFGGITYLKGKYAALSGTSIASPHVSGTLV